ncbi:MAG: histidine kinase, partial [Ferruginibacter sp.]
PSNLIRSVYQSGDSIFWIATNAGLCKTQALPGTKAKFEVVIPDVECNFIFEDGKGFLWVNSKYGSYKFNRKTEEWQFFGKEDGYYWEPYDGKKFLMPDGQFLMPDGQFMNPSSIPSNLYKPIPVITGIDVFNNPYHSDTALLLKKVLYLEHFQNFLSIHYSCDSYINENENTYYYKLEGIDTGWVYADKRTTAYYTQVPPGNYHFYVKVANNDGLIGESKQLLALNNIPAWYQTWWFKLLCVVVIISIVYFFYQQRIQKEKAKGLAKSSEARLKQLSAEFEKQIAETEMVALRAQMNPHFIFNVLNSINKYILVNEGEKASFYLTQFSRLIRQVLENSKSEKVPLEADLQALKLYIEMEKLRFGDQFSYDIKVDKEIDQQFVQLPPLLIQPYAENAIWHGLMQKKEKGHLNIIITSPEINTLKVIIEDDGIGRKEANMLKSKSATKHKSFGMQITKDRIAIVNKLFNMEATIQFDDLENHGIATGTRVTLNIPV